MSAAVEQRNQDATCYCGNLDEKATEELLWELMLQVRDPIRSDPKLFPEPPPSPSSSVSRTVFSARSVHGAAPSGERRVPRVWRPNARRVFCVSETLRVFYFRVSETRSASDRRGVGLTLCAW